MSYLTKIVSIANKLDSLGLTKEADLLDRFIVKTASGFFETESERESEEESLSATRQRIIDAIKRSIGDPYFENIFRMRNPSGESEGSTFITPQTPETLMASTWERWKHPDVKEPAVAFRAPSIAGYFGILNLEKLPQDSKVSIVREHKGSGTNAVCIITDGSVKRQTAKYTTMLLGPGNGGEVVWTFFPGPPISPSNLPWNDSLEDSIKTVSDAIAFGFTYGKLSGS